MTPGPVPCWSCGRPVLPGSLTCRSCGVLVDGSEGRGEGDSASAAAAVGTETIEEREATDGLGSGGIVSPFKVPGSYLSPSAVHQSTDPERGAPVPSSPVAPGSVAPGSVAPGSVATGSVATGSVAPARASMPLAGTLESGMAAEPDGSTRSSRSPDDTTATAAADVPGMTAADVPGMTAAAVPPPSPASGRGPGTGLTGPKPGEAPLFADLPFDAPSTLVGWLVTLGSGLAALSFLLPWAPGIVNYTSSWGLSSIANLPVLAILIATAVLAILPNPIPHWVRSAVLPLIGGSLFAGLLWPYVLGDFGAEFGSIAGMAAAVVLVVGGILAVAPRTAKAPTT